MKILRRLILTFSVLPSFALADSGTCSALVQYGLRDEIQSVAHSNNFTQSASEFCRDYKTYTEDKKSGNVKASYGAFSGSAGFSAERYGAMSDVLCTNAENTSNLTSGSQLTNRLLNPAALQTLKDCEALNSYGLKVTTDFSPSNETLILSFLMTPVPGTTGSIKVEAPIVDDGITCDGPSPAISDKSLPMLTSVTYRCSRKPSTEPFIYQGVRLYAKSGIVSIPTTSGPVTRTLPPIYAEALPPTELEKKLKALAMGSTPVGTIIASYFSYEEITKADPEFASFWQPADGRNVVRDSAYFKAKTDGSLNNVKLPDLRGTFLRGLNIFENNPLAAAQNAAQLDPENRKVGQFQADENRAHGHSASISAGETNVRGTGMGHQANKGEEIQWRSLSVSIGNSGGPESRPKNYAVYYYIRVN